MLRPCATLVLLALLLPSPPLSFAQVQPDIELGDAPEGAVAYPSTGVAGQFPTCIGGPVGDIQHAWPSRLYFGLSVDPEFDGNADFCPAPPYEQDECWGAADGDGGLVSPDGFTIFQNQVVPCGQTPARPLGDSCELIDANGPNSPLEINVFNDTGADAVINVLADWNQDGQWNGQVQCPNHGPLDEHWIQNLFVPANYIGPLQGLAPGQLRLGPNDGYVWFRFTVSLPFPPIQPGWDGSGFFDGGETEDYLLRLDKPESAEYGDAPEEALAYPDNGVNGNFPTCRTAGSAGFVQHLPTQRCWLGPLVDYEQDGNANFCPQPPYDQDECDRAGGDAGLLFPDPLTIVNNSYRRCSNDARDRWIECRRARWGLHLDVDVTNTTPDERYFHFLADWDRNGEWGGAQTCPDGNVVEERVLLNFPVPGNYSGPLSGLLPPNFQIGTEPGPVWCRFSITDTQVPADWTGDGNFDEGETEDYLIRVGAEPTDVPPHAGDRLGELRAAPNPFNPSTSLVLELRGDGPVELQLLDERGRVVRQLHRGELTAGEHRWNWDGLDDGGRPVASGVYHAVVRAGDEQRRLPLVLLK